MAVPDKERLLVSKIRDFIDKDKNDSIALIVGIRKTGKTTILDQLENSYKESLKILRIDCSAEQNGCNMIDEIVDSRADLVLIDEISYLNSYEEFSQTLYNMTNGLNGKNFKVVMTGSSSAHIMKLSGTKLGARAKLFRLPPLTFIEYLYFTDRIPSYTNYSTVKNSDFSDYLQLKGLEEKAAGLAITFNKDYFDAMYNEVEISNRKSQLTHSITNLNEGDLLNVINILAYKLSEAETYEKTTEPEIGAKEHYHLVSNREAKIKWSQVDLSNTIIEDSAKAIPGITEADIGRILNFLLWAGLATIEYTHVDKTDQAISAISVTETLRKCTHKNDLIQLFKDISICMSSPLYYTRIGEEIMRRMKVSEEKLYKGTLYGKMLEIYIRGVLSAHSSGIILASHKMKYPDTGGNPQEVDIYDLQNRLLLESTISDKDAREIHVHDYFQEHEFIRVCCSNTKDYFDKKYRIYRIPYAKLCCMIDTGEIFTQLHPTKMNDILDVNSVAKAYKDRFDVLHLFPSD